MTQAKEFYDEKGLETASQQMGMLITCYMADALGFDFGELKELQAALGHLFQRLNQKTNEAI